VSRDKTPRDAREAVIEEISRAAEEDFDWLTKNRKLVESAPNATPEQREKMENQLRELARGMYVAGALFGWHMRQAQEIQPMPGRGREEKEEQREEEEKAVLIMSMKRGVA